MKIIATVRRDKERIDDQQHFVDRIDMLIKSNVNIFRINVAKWHKDKFNLLIEDIALIRKLYKSECIKIMLDIPLPGDKSRIYTNNMKDVMLKKGQNLYIYSKNIDISPLDNCIQISLEQIGKKLSVDEEIIYGDGEGKLKVKEIIDYDKVNVVSLNDFVIEHSKSLNFKKSFEYCKEREKEIIDLTHMIKPDILALSFVEEKKQVEDIKMLTSKLKCQIMCKIETQKGIDNINEILQVSDSIMVARGDLGLNVDLNKFAIAQDNIISSCIIHNKKVYVATDVLGSMCKNKFPRRGDLIDLYNIRKSGANGVVLTYGLVRSEQIVDAINLITKQ